MFPRICSAVALAVLSLCPLIAQQPAWIDPIAPTSNTPIEVRFRAPCGASDERVERVGMVVKVTLRLGALCSPPNTFPHATTIGLLPPGEYRLEIFNEGVNGVYASTQFVVRSAEKAKYVLHPFAVRANISGLRLRIESAANTGLFCFGFESPLCPVVIRIGGNEITKVDNDHGAAVFDAPRLPKGLYDVTVVRGSSPPEIIPAALYAYDDPDPSVFERILFPISANVPGANGSRWETETVIANPNPWSVENFNSIEPIVCLLFPCRERISPRSERKFSGGLSLNGIALLVPRPEAPDLAFSLRVRDVSRVAESFGTSIPVVREKDMFRNKVITLLDVPRDPRYRVKLRMYAFEPFFDLRWEVTIVDRDGGTSTSQLFSEPSCAFCPDEPAYAELDLPPGPTGFVTISIRAPQESFAWAFASVTNNETQQVTAVVP